MDEILEKVKQEVSRQFLLWNEQNHPDGTGKPGDSQRVSAFKVFMKSLASSGDLTWRDILYEEVLEVFDETEPKELRTELIQVAAVAVSWAEALDRRQKNGQDHQNS